MRGCCPGGGRRALLLKEGVKVSEARDPRIWPPIASIPAYCYFRQSRGGKGAVVTRGYIAHGPVHLIPCRGDGGRRRF
jgi:hypothetical protein